MITTEVKYVEERRMWRVRVYNGDGDQVGEEWFYRYEAARYWADRMETGDAYP